MARRRRQSNGEAIVELIALLPWWLCVLLAFISWLVFHSIASSPVPAVGDVRQMGSGFFLGIGARGISHALQYAAPVLCLLAAIVSFARRRKRLALVENVTESRSADALNGMSWREFEMLVGEAFRLQGYEVKEQGGARPDGGVDLVLRKGNESFVVQCKQWKALKVGVDVVRELYGVMAAQGAAGGFVVTSGRFTEDAMAFAAGRNLRLIDGPKLFGLLQQARASIGQRREAPLASPVMRPEQAASINGVPACPVCNAPMVRRTARKGPTLGSQFWGCSTFPACRGTR